MKAFIARQGSEETEVRLSHPFLIQCVKGDLTGCLEYYQQRFMTDIFEFLSRYSFVWQYMNGYLASILVQVVLELVYFGWMTLFLFM